MITNSRKYYLYRHIRLDKNEVFYVGLGTKPKKDYPHKTAFAKNARNIFLEKDL